MLNCPVDRSELTSTQIEDVPVFRCPECGGHWLNGGDLETLSEHHGHHDQPAPAGKFAPGDGVRVCPIDQTPLQASTFIEHKNLRVDSCPTCRGLWLDSNELEVLLSLNNGDEQSQSTLGQRTMLFLYELTAHPPLI